MYVRESEVDIFVHFVCMYICKGDRRFLCTIFVFDCVYQVFNELQMR